MDRAYQLAVLCLLVPLCPILQSRRILQHKNSYVKKETTSRNPITLALSADDASRLHEHLVKSGWSAHTPRK